ncbi:hypothetical protein NEOLEDRAFT_1151159 [Neolentinus lepideus HHB14362 ss-1]|uniref:Uncharacterized protein n=1 Tax=Neolentinus lepideus HHB14362 ss-1 TaxID=1314782 RepID=A0A165P8S6_9AGAM|nr:hypothetical protein NEOLEDRAFT_1151159 [Neolentinus lepideus HHB14362 ss-1]
MSTDSASSTPLLLTPESTGSTVPSSVSSEVKKSRRQTAFYPNMKSSTKPQKPFSRSAAKRESVMALGSIEHLQHYFTKTGLSTQQESLGRQKKGLVPALGGLQNISTQIANQLQPSELPPTPAAPQINRPAFPPYVKTFETNPDTLRTGVIEDLIAMNHAWELDEDQPSFHPDQSLLGVRDGSKNNPTGNIDVLNLLKISTHAIRSVRNYVISLPDDSIVRILDDFRPKATPSKPVVKRVVSQSNTSSDPLAMIRRSALEVLTALRELEENSRLPLSDDAYDAQSDHGSSSHDASSHSRGASPLHMGDDDQEDAEPTIAFSLVKVRGRNESVPVWEDDNVDFNDMTEEEMQRREHWDERLVLGGGWLYKQDIRLEYLKKERDTIQRYLDLVDDILFGGRTNGQRGWLRERASKNKSRRVSTGDVENYSDLSSRRSSRRVVSANMLDSMRNMSVVEEPEPMESLTEEEGEAVDDDDLPEWAQRNAFQDSSLGRVHAVLSALLPQELLSTLPQAPSNRSILLHALSSGQLLCVAYNAGVRRSRQPWGFINKHEIHDIIAMEHKLSAEEKEEKNKTGWTYRRLDNLRLWSGGLKLRYSLPIQILPKPGVPLNLNVTPTPSPQPSPSALKTKFSAAEMPFTFDTRTIARKDEGWEEMLETAVVKWANAVAEEQRGERQA